MREKGGEIFPRVLYCLYSNPNAIVIIRTTWGYNYYLEIQLLFNYRTNNNNYFNNYY